MGFLKKLSGDFTHYKKTRQKSGATENGKRLTPPNLWLKTSARQDAWLVKVDKIIIFPALNNWKKDTKREKKTTAGIK